MGTNPNEVESEARSLINSLSKEIDSIPNYKGSTTDFAGEAPLSALSDAVTAGRKAIRFLRGKPSKSNLVEKRNSLMKIVSDAEKLRSIDFSKEGGNKKEARTLSTLTKAEYRAKQERARER